MPRSRRHPPTRAAAMTAAGALAVGAALGLGACSSSSSTSSSPSPSAPVTGSFSGSVPSALQSRASAGLSSASIASASLTARASAFASSASAEVTRQQAAYQSALANVSGSGNAVGDVTLTGVPLAQAGGLNAVIVNITNSTGSATSYAVQIDWKDSAGNVVDSDVVGAENLAAGGHASPTAFSRKDVGTALTPVVAKAQRY
ncbi:hypothetical protein LN042_06640 [Kitasatospora sp. RB6PN24]|uniref:hypothetical protein n=1 Tax=Kitasatospora humi TaxID=2893891 RepID=UPI001E5216A4|nr:hypothetical protein [Kitasatospora humi]MCC9306785.1 hypothetical protein [Kitasatospora humi]